ncbi:TonB-dependent receptor domain-containing protein [Peristeroidobacter soli]|uniref:TonB-dependent receptor domain-containing protein n=1 Tax=Peristeroidobacter soli TaxID=2497877 RepID=UPI00101C560E|nr:TonB-dependent receptor [Peristeroidobacter soli]
MATTPGIRGSIRLALSATACSAILLAGAASLAAQPAAARAIVHDLSIPSQPLSDALKALSAAANEQLLFSQELVEGKRSGAVAGAYTTDQALDLLLAGSGLIADRTPSGVLLIRDPAKARKSGNNQAKLLRTAALGESNEQMPLASDRQPLQLAAQQSSRETISLEEIVVTATKREARLFDVPLSVSVLTSDQVTTSGAVTLADLAYSVPGFTAINTAPNQQQYFIRGIASRSGLPTVGTYLDEVATGSRNASQSTDVRPLDIERVEVLRGPQGTLFGEGSMGGTIRIITRKPRLDAYSFGVDGEYYDTNGGDASTSVSAFANIPLVEDKFALRVVGLAQDVGGWLDETVLGREDINNVETRTGRLKGLWAPTESLQIGFMLLKQKVEGDGINSGTGDGLATNSLPQPLSDEYELYNLTVDYDFGAVKLLSSTAQVNRDYSVAVSVEGYAALFNPPPPSPPLFQGALLNGVVGTEDFSQEFRLTSNTDGRWSWTAGAFYRKFEYLEDSYTQLSVVSALPGIVPDMNLLTAYAPMTSKSKAVFGESSWKLTERLEATVGLRWYEDEQHQVNRTLTPGLPTTVTEGEATFDALTPRFNLAYRFSNDRMVYFNAAQGFRSGGFNLTVAPPGVVIAPSYDPEDLWTYEVGTKLVFAQGKLVLEGAVFHNEWKDVQSLFTPFVGSPFSVTTNGGKATGTGFDWNIRLRATPALTLGLGGSYIDAQYDVATLDKKKDDPMDFVARLSGSLTADYEFRLGAVPAYLNITGQYQERMPYTETQLTSYSDDLYFLNTRVGARFKALDVYLFGRNLTDEDGKIDPFNTSFSGARPRPRQIGIGLSMATR